jgi:hypothetical protein
MCNARQLQAFAAELERLGVPAHDGGRLQTFDCLALPVAEMLRRLHRLPDGAGISAVNAALLAESADSP